MINILMGYTVEDLNLMYKFYLHEKQGEPKDLYELINFWHQEKSMSPLKVLKLGLKLAHVYTVKSGDGCGKLVESFLISSKACI